jgi:hypothetical protein
MAARAKQVGVDVIIAQGIEAGGHVAGFHHGAFASHCGCGRTGALVLGAGGIGDARGVADALCLGADDVVIGTRFLALVRVAEGRPLTRALKMPVRDYLGSVLPGLSNFPINRIAELTPAAWTTRN